MEHDELSLIEAYLNQELTSEELKQVEERITADPIFAQLVEECRILFAGVQEAFRKDLLAELKEIGKDNPISNSLEETTFQEDENQIPEDAAFEGLINKWKHSNQPLPNKEKSKSNFWRWGLAMLIILILMGLVWGFWPRATEEEKLFQAYFEAPALVGNVTRGANNEFKALQEQAFKAYNQGNLKKAAPLFKELYEGYQDTLSLFYLGISQLGTNQTDQAVTHLETINQINDDIRLEHIEYYLALGYWKQEKTTGSNSVIGRKSAPKGR